MVAHGADPSLTNEEDQFVRSTRMYGCTVADDQAADMLEEDHPDIADYLRSLSNNADHVLPSDAAEPQISQHAVDSYTSNQTSELIEESQRIMAEAERDGVDPDERLKELVERAVREGVAFGAAAHGAQPDEDELGGKRGRNGTQ